MSGSDGAAIIDGRAISGELKAEVKHEIDRLKRGHGLVPGLAVVLVGDDPASTVYVRNKARAAADVGIASFERRLPADTAESTLLNMIAALNADPAIHGILVQFPLPGHLGRERVVEAIDPVKDVDGLHPLNVGRLASGLEAMVPCTPQGCMVMLARQIGDMAGLDALVIGRSSLVGKPVAQLLLGANCTVTVAHSRTVDLAGHARCADILVAAIGQPMFVKGGWIKPGAVVVDVGINRVAAPEKGDGATRLVGDVDFEAARKVAGAITPVPGGVGLMTVACLMRNTVIAARRQCGL